MQKIKRGDLVQVIKGKDAGKKAKVLRLFPSQGRAIVEGLNLSKKHKRRTREDDKGGIVSIEQPLALSNLMLFCKSCNRPVRCGFMLLSDGTKSRICRKCKETI
ncbi:MAG: 50S ribosomal protein L24 [Candidatus Omnitrophota bacterium]|nr:MAG: 50S ribosomal protein L24 [Candidatus Omnitrophota bacterium]